MVGQTALIFALVCGLVAVAYGWQTAFIAVGLLGLIVAPVLLLTVHWARDFATGATTTLVTSVRSMSMMLSSALLARAVFGANTGVVNNCVSPTDVPTALVATSRQ